MGWAAPVKFAGARPILMGTGRSVVAYARAPFPFFMTLDNILSKVLAAGLAAGVFLLWWPAHLPSSGVPWLVMRGVAWTLAFEILMLSFVPLERMAIRGLVRWRAASGARRVQRRLASAPAPARAGGAVLLAFTGALVPLLLLAHAGRPPATPAVRPPTVVRKIVVRKVVRERTVVVRTAPAQAIVPTPPGDAKPAAAKAAPHRPKVEPVTKADPTATTTSPAATDPATTPPPTATSGADEAAPSG
jgi:hypothetical protein